MTTGQYINESMFLDSGGRAALDKYRCPKCSQLLKNAVQPSCGHWLCEECAKGLFATSSPPTCPRTDCQEELECEVGTEYFPDRFVRKEIQNLNVRCYGHDNGCSWTGKLKDFEDHFKQCPFATEECKFCGSSFHTLELSSHMASCPKAGKLCPLADLGCTAGRMSAPQLKQHCSDTIMEHFDCLATAVKDLKIQLEKRQPTLGDIVEEDAGSQHDSGYSYFKKGSRVSHQSQRREQYDSGYGSSYRKQVYELWDIEEKDGMSGPLLEGKLGSALSGISSAMESSRVQIMEELLPQLKKRDEELAALKERTTKLEKQLRIKNSELEDRDFRLSLIENSSFDGTMVWKIPQFEQRMADARNGKYTSIFSLPFYTGRYGYKMCLRLYILGDGTGKNTHMSLFFVIMKNEFDNILQWPFTHRVTFKLVNQRGGRDIVETFQPDPTSSSFRKPKSDMNIASGCPKFVSHQELRNGFVVDDTIFIKCSVDLSSIRAI